jgi:hypothetical protein
MRLALVLFLFALVPGVFAQVSVVRTWPSYRTAESFKRVSEYFTGRESTGGQTYLRSQPGERAGFYFLLRLRNKGQPVTGATLQLQLITQHAPTPVNHTHTVEVPKGDHVYQIGLTGKDWPNPAEHPVAWRILLTDTAGNILASDQSYLWSKEG